MQTVARLRSGVRNATHVRRCMPTGHLRRDLKEGRRRNQPRVTKPLQDAAEPRLIRDRDPGLAEDEFPIVARGGEAAEEDQPLR